MTEAICDIIRADNYRQMLCSHCTVRYCDGSDTNSAVLVVCWLAAVSGAL
jgi:hypothetical protein